jgi:beta-N-acetylhexosaminidase
VGPDPHHALGVVRATRAELDRQALVPFRAAIEAGARVAMSSHVAIPAITGDPTLPATLSPTVMRTLLRDELGFGGVTISDALDMRALAQGAAQAEQVVAAVNAGVDLLLCSADRDALERIEAALVDAAARGRFVEAELAAASERIQSLRAWLGDGSGAPDISIVGSAEHRALSRELAERSVTLVRGAGDAPSVMVPVHARILAIMPQPADLTPADTSSTVPTGLGRALRTRFTSVEETVVGVAPSSAEISALRGRSAGFDAVVVGTIDAIRQPAQFDLVEAVASAGRPTIAVALRTPWDVARYPASVAAACTYSILPDSLEALASGLVGAIPFVGRLPVTV